MFHSSRFRRISLTILAVTVSIVFAAPRARSQSPESGSPPVDQAVCEQLGLQAESIQAMQSKPLYQFNEAEVDGFLKYLAATETDLRQRIVRLARKNIGQPYELYLLGEMPFETYDPQPLYCLSKSDCVVFVEHTYAMALAHDWPSFFRYLQRIRYTDGKIGVATRNHYTEADWNPSNRWLVEDITREIAGSAAVDFRQKIDRGAFLKKRYGLDVDIPVEQHTDVYMPYDQMDGPLPQLKDGDFVNVVRGYPIPSGQSIHSSAWVGHVGLVARGDSGELHFIHSTKPQVREETIGSYIARANEKRTEGKPQLLGFKFLRLCLHPQANLAKIDGAEAPRIHVP